MKLGDTIYFIDNNQYHNSIPTVREAQVEKLVLNKQIMAGWREGSTHMATALFSGGENWSWFYDRAKAEKALRPLPKFERGTLLWTLNSKNDPAEIRFGYLAIGQRNFKVRCYNTAGEQIDFELSEMRKKVFTNHEKAVSASRRAKIHIPFFGR